LLTITQGVKEAIMEHILMHKNIPVLDVIMSENGTIDQINRVHDLQRCPIGVQGYAE
jgi:hypothetical protein